MQIVDGFFSSGSAPAGLYVRAAAVVTLTHNILAYNLPIGDCFDDNGTGTTIDGSYNLIEDTGVYACGLVDGVNGNIIGADPLLEPLADNGPSASSGQATKTHALQIGSPALDAVPSGSCVLATDQRGVVRPFGAGCDSGAVEYILTCPTFPTTVGNETAWNEAILCYNSVTTPGSYTISFSNNITLTASSLAVENGTSGISLLVDGAGYGLDGQNIDGVRPFHNLTGAVTLSNLTIQGGNMNDVSCDDISNVIDALYIMQCEVGITNPFCPTVQASESLSIEGSEELAADSPPESAAIQGGIRPSHRATSIWIDSGEVGEGQPISLPSNSKYGLS